ncbi:peptidase S41-like protein [Maribacter vaceletii]|uniref:Peptidase S41-like protein n=1 Tax=Maribacter vaceletii TaxID=1206816 RepID=A0A495E8E8_9FLAO|nr:S41 family peptidase [Maribacter vaceletii]RKR13076.1 peptidase S41-like protein [Maribacter vaceletii]
MRNKLTAFLAVFFLAFICNGQDVEEWIEDIDYYHKTLEIKHINLYHTISKNQFTSEIEKLKSNIPQLTNFQITTELMRLTHKVGAGKRDGHTSVPLWGVNLNKFPIKFYDFEGDLRVISILENHAQLLGKKLKSINGIPVKKIYKRVSKLTPFTENIQSSMDRKCRYLVVADLLKALNIIDKIEQSTFTFSDNYGKEISVQLNSFEKEKYATLTFKNIHLNPIIKKPKTVKDKDLWFSSINNSKTVYINFKKYPSRKEMNDFSESVFKFIEANNSQHLIIDLRDNYGGDFYKGLLLANWLNISDSVEWLSKVYVLTNRKTYSAAMINALQFKQLLHAKIIGEPSGGKPNGYQDMGEFSLSNSKLIVTYSKREFQFHNRKNKSLKPDVLITPKWKNFKKGYDETLNWVLKDITN